MRPGASAQRVTWADAVCETAAAPVWSELDAASSGPLQTATVAAIAQSNPMAAARPGCVLMGSTLGPEYVATTRAT
jgi:hypothetical protein